MENLIGLPVMVHPQLTTDPARMQGKVGLVAGIDLARDNLLVAFGNEGSGNYQADGLLTLKPHQELYQDLLEKVKQLDISDFKSLLRLNMHQESGSMKQVQEAFAALAGSIAALNFATRPLPAALELDIGAAQQQAHGIGR